MEVGFPKSMNIGLAIDKKKGVESKVVGKGKSGAKETHQNSLNLVKNPFGGEYEIKEAQNEWKGWGTALKPAFEPIIVARKPFKCSLVDNVIKWGVGGLNIDECRVGFENGETNSSINRYNSKPQRGNNGWEHKNRGTNFNEDTKKSMQLGRFPANLILTYEQMTFDEVCGGFPDTKNITKTHIAKNSDNNVNFNASKEVNIIGYNDDGSACRYFYCAKASKKDRDEGLEGFEEKLPACVTDFRPTLATNPENWNNGNPVDNPMMRTKPRKNIHPTVKPTTLMQYLVRLVTPNGGIVLDPFMGSGSTGKAVMYENLERNKNYSFIGIEKEQEYFEIAKNRIWR